MQPTASVEVLDLVGFPICCLCTTGNLLASYKIKQLDEATLERNLISCKPLCGDVKLACYQTSIKGVCGLANMAGFALSPPHIAAAGVGISSPILMTGFYLLDKEEKIQLPLVLGSWFGFGLVIHLGYIHSTFGTDDSTFSEWAAIDWRFKIGFVSFWLTLAMGMDRLNQYLQDTKYSGFVACMAAYQWFSLSGGIAYIYGKMVREDPELAAFGSSLLAPLLLFGQRFVSNIKIAETNACELIFGFAQLYFPGSHATFMYFFAHKYRQTDEWVEVLLYFQPILYLVGWAFFNVYLNTVMRTELPELYYMPASMLQFAQEIRTQSQCKQHNQNVTQSDNKTTFELLPRRGHPVFERFLEMNPKGAVTNDRSVSGTLSPVAWSDDDAFEAYRV